MGRSQVLYNQKRGRGRGRAGGRQQGRGGGSSTRQSTAAPRNSVGVPQPQPVPATERQTFSDDQAEHLLSLGSATANAHALRGGSKDNNNEWTLSSTKCNLNPIALGATLHRGYSRTELLRLPPHIVSHVYGRESNTVSKTTTLIDVTGMTEMKVEEDDNCIEEQESENEEEEEDDDDCVVYLGTKQPDDQNSEDDLDGWLDSVIS